MTSSKSLKELTNAQLIRLSNAIANEMLALNEELNRATDLPYARKGLMHEFYRYQSEIEKRNIEW